MNLVSAASYIFAKNQDCNEWCVLCGKRGATAPSCPNKYNVPTGMRDFADEDIASCAAREVYEETNLKIPKSMFKFIESEEWAKGKFGANFLVILPNDTSNYNIGNGDGENSKFIWLPMSELNNLPWAYNMNKTVEKMFSNVEKNTLMENMRRMLLENKARKNMHLEQQKSILNNIKNAYFLLKEETSPDDFLYELYGLSGKFIQRIKQAERTLQCNYFNIPMANATPIKPWLHKPDEVIMNDVTSKEYHDMLYQMTERIYKEWVEALLDFKKTCRFPWMKEKINDCIEHVKQEQKYLKV